MGLPLPVPVLVLWLILLPPDVRSVGDSQRSVSVPKGGDLVEFAGSTANLVAGPKEDAGPPSTENPAMAEPKNRRTGDLAAVPPEAVIDGDTFLLQGKKIRLYGIDRDRQTADFATGKRLRAFSGIEKAVRLKLDRFEAAATLHDLAALPGNRLKPSVVTAEGSTASASTIAGGFALNGPKGHPDPRMSKSSITTSSPTLLY